MSRSLRIFGTANSASEAAKKTLTWKEVLRELHRQGYDIHKDEFKLKADYKVAKDYAETFYNGRPFSSPSSRKSEAR